MRSPHLTSPEGRGIRFRYVGELMHRCTKHGKHATGSLSLWERSGEGIRCPTKSPSARPHPGRFIVRLPTTQLALIHARREPASEPVGRIRKRNPDDERDADEHRAAGDGSRRVQLQLLRMRPQIADQADDIIRA
jgi:hypothetical protein